jgi:hypothetical protein
MKEIDPVSAAARAFVAVNPDYRQDSKTMNEMVDFMLENDLPQTDAESWQKAYDAVCRDSVGYDAGRFRADGTREVYMDREAIEKIPADVMKDRLKDPIFAHGVNLILGDKQ